MTVQSGVSLPEVCLKPALGLPQAGLRAASGRLCAFWQLRMAGSPNIAQYLSRVYPLYAVGRQHLSNPRRSISIWR